MRQNDLSVGFVKTLIKLTNSDKLVWQHYDLNGRGYQFDSDIAYCGTWMLCLDTVKNSLILQVAESFNCFTEFAGVDYGFGELYTAVALQRSRQDRGYKMRGPLPAPHQIAKFINDKVLKAKKDTEDRETVLEKCSRTLKCLAKGEEYE